MVTGYVLIAPACQSACRDPRHLHASPGLDRLGIPCACGATSWAVHYGGPLPTRVVCLGCLAGTDLEAVLRANGRRRPW